MAWDVFDRGGHSDFEIILKVKRKETREWFDTLTNVFVEMTGWSVYDEIRCMEVEMSLKESTIWQKDVGMKITLDQREHLGWQWTQKTGWIRPMLKSEGWYGRRRVEHKTKEKGDKGIKRKWKKEQRKGTIKDKTQWIENAGTVRLRECRASARTSISIRWAHRSVLL